MAKEVPGNLELGAFSISLAVADLEVSRAFYEKLGFETTGGSADENYLILVNGTTIIGLFHKMFEDNILTFNPGLSNSMEQLGEFTDVREIERHLELKGLKLEEHTEEGSTGAAHITLIDPDGNPILIDQFF